MKSSIKLELAKELAAPELQALRGVFPVAPTERDVAFLFKGRRVTSFASWDVLGIGGRRDVVSTIAQVVDQYGWSPSASRLSGGATLEVSRCEGRVAQFLGAEESVLFSGRNQCVLTLITTLFSESDIVLAPALAQAPVADACALVGAEFVPVDEWDSLALIERCKGRRRVCIFVESLQLVTGDLPDFPKLFTVADAIGAWLIIDESGAFGVHGLRGAGSADLFKWHPNLLARIVSFTRVACLSGAAVAGPSELIELLSARSRYLRVESGEPPPLALGIVAALDAIESSVMVREQLSTRSRLLREQIALQGWSVRGAVESPILAIVMDSSRDAFAIADALLQRNLLVEGLSSKGRGKDGGAVRVVISSRHTEADFDNLLESLRVIRARYYSNLPG